MYRRCDNDPLALGVGRGPEWLLAASLLFALAGCGSNSTVPDASVQPVDSSPVPVEPPAAETFPLESAAVRPTAPDDNPAATNAPAVPPATTAKTTKSIPTDPNAPAVVEPPLPPEAVQQFDNAVAMVASGNLSAAEQAFRALSIAYPSYSGPLVNLGILQTKAGKLDEAEKTLQSAIERRPDNASAYNHLGIVYRRQGRFRQAEEAYSRAVQIDPDYANAHLNLGVLCDLYLQQPQRALEAFERYLTLTSTPDDKVSGWVKELKVRLGNTDRASGTGS